MLIKCKFKNLYFYSKNVELSLEWICGNLVRWSVLSAQNQRQHSRNGHKFCCTNCCSIFLCVLKCPSNKGKWIVSVFLKSAAILNKGRTGSIPVSGTIPPWFLLPLSTHIRVFWFLIIRLSQGECRIQSWRQMSAWFSWTFLKVFHSHNWIHGAHKSPALFCFLVCGIGCIWVCGSAHPWIHWIVQLA